MSETSNVVCAWCGAVGPDVPGWEYGGPVRRGIGEDCPKGPLRGMFGRGEAVRPGVDVAWQLGGGTNPAGRDVVA